MKMLWECDLIGGILSKAVDNVEALENMYLLPWETPHFAGWDIARTVLDEIINDGQDISDRLQDILGREETGKGHAVTDAELAMSQLERKVLATRLRVATRAQDFRNLLEEASGASQPAFTRYRHGAMDRDVASANAIMVTRECDRASPRKPGRTRWHGKSSASRDGSARAPCLTMSPLMPPC